jgi:hypothetical protein
MKQTRFLVVGTCLVVLAGGATAAWLLRDRLGGSPSRPEHPARPEYDAFVAHLGGDEPAIRDELNELIGSASATLDPADRTRANALTRECLDPRVLLDIEHVRAFLAPASRGEASPFHFVGDAEKARLMALAGDDLTSKQVLAVRDSLARLAAEFDLIRQPPDWKITIEGEPLPLPFLELLRDAHQFLPYSRHPELRASPRIPAFAGADAELLAQLDQFFNGARARAALPPDKFPKLYVNGRIPPVPTAIDEYRGPIAAAIKAEMTSLIELFNKDAGLADEITETYDKLGRFFEAVAAFGK